MIAARVCARGSVSSGNTTRLTKFARVTTMFEEKVSASWKAFHGKRPQKRYNAKSHCESLVPNFALKIPANMIVKITIMTTGVTIAHSIPNTEPLYRAANSRLVSDQTRSIRCGNSHNGRHTARLADCAEIICVS